MRCISVYTDRFDLFSDIYEKVRRANLQEDEETVIDGIVVTESGSVPEHYLNRMRSRRDVVVMKDDDITILQRRDVFEILFPDHETPDHQANVLQ
ncbi:hypothetical protein PRECH8_02390 [Insulibacter thermoxylanivorax]|uniref:NAD/NADP transhydrogenase alpha subunit n=1 Tax=Insulibacter thermoxylanivorax TaxID=2749268 RepID=A0A916QCN7_9BACL|nr:NAD/NADP transhydrogenase alpha subunit [Insulibacter thermoxylanivorax]GFR36943.1 hypothetical protein PRECH8_02390 [Insulibacter thermoxylanivorax]